jgi:hypothetical protein
MPTISSFYGVSIRMYWADHAPPHFHAQYGGHEASIEILTLRVARGSLASTRARVDFGVGSVAS